MTATQDYVLDNGVLITDRSTLIVWIETERGRNGRHYADDPLNTLDAMRGMPEAELEAIAKLYHGMICANLDVEADTIRLCGEVES